MEKELREIIESKIEILSEKKASDVMNVSVPFIQADEKNINGRIYPKSLLQREISRVQGLVKRGSFIGTGDHPFSGIENIATASHIVTSLTLDDKGKVMAELRILPTERGKSIQTLIRNNATLGVSVRGFGDVGKDGVVANSYKLVGLDVVMNPSFKDSVFDKSNIFESVEFFEEKEENMKDKMMGLSQDYIDEMMQDCYEIYVRDEGFKGTFADFEKENGRLTLAVILVEEGKFETIGEALKHLDANKDSEKQISALDKETYLGATEMGFHGTQEEFEELLSEKTSDQELTEGQISVRMHSYYRESVQGGFIGSYEEWQTAYPKLVEMASEGKIIEKKLEPIAPFKSKCSWAEIVQSGFEGSMDEYREKFPNIEIVIEEAPEKIVVEKALTEKTLKEEAGRIFTALAKENPNSQLALEDVEKMLKIEEEKKVDVRIKRKAVQIVSRDMFNSGGDVSEEKMEKMVKAEVERLTEERKLRRQKNWQVYKKLLSE